MRMIRILFFVGLSGLSAMTFMACTSEKEASDHTTKSNGTHPNEQGASASTSKNDGTHPKAKGTSASEALVSTLCAHSLKVMKRSGNDLKKSDSDNLASCQKAMTALKAKVGEETWSSFAECALSAQNILQMYGCQKVHLDKETDSKPAGEQSTATD